MGNPIDQSRMRSDWNTHHNAESIKAVIGKDMRPEAFWASGETQYVERIAPHLMPYFPAGLEDKISLEIGCGPGRLLRPMSRRFATCIGFDVSDQAIALARRELSDVPNATLICGDGSHLSQIESSSVDVVISYDVFQHLPTADVQQSHLVESARVLKPAGAFAIQIKTNSGWMRFRQIPVLPRALRGFVPDAVFLAYLIAIGRRGIRRRATWKGHLFDHSKVRQVFAKAGLKVDNLVADQKDNRWIVVGTPIGN